MNKVQSWVVEKTLNFPQKITSETYSYLSKPDGLLTIDLIGTLPTDNALVENRVPSKMRVNFYINNLLVLSCNANVTVQGAGSRLFNKHNWSLDFLNDKNKALTVKVGDLIGTDSVHLKGYWTDNTCSRDVVFGKLWYSMRTDDTYPNNRIDNIPLDLSVNAQSNNIYAEDAKFFPDGLPIQLKVNGSFYGTYVYRLKKGRANYRMVKTVKSQILLDYDYTIRYMKDQTIVWTDWNQFSAEQFELKNPSVAGYNPGDDITDTDILTPIQNLFAWTNSVSTNTITDKENANNVAVLNSWLDYYILCELIGHIDGLNNNMLIATWDGAHFSIMYNDGDQTGGVDWTGISVSKTDFILDHVSGDRSFWANFRTIYSDEIKVRYTKLRNDKIINLDYIQKLFINHTSKYGVDMYKQDLSLWGGGAYQSTGKQGVSQVLTYINSSIQFLDNIWLNS